MDPVPVHVVEPVDGRVDRQLRRAVRRRDIETLLAARAAGRAAARLEADRLRDSERLAGLAVAVRGRVVVGEEAEDHDASQLHHRQRLDEGDRLREDGARLLSEVLAGAGVLVLPAIVLEEVVADLPREIDAVALLEESRLRVGEGAVGLVAEGEVGIVGVDTARACARARARARGGVVTERDQLGDLVRRHRLDGVHGVAMGFAEHPRRADAHPLERAARVRGLDGREAAGDLAMELVERGRVDEVREIGVRLAEDACEARRATGRNGGTERLHESLGRDHPGEGLGALLDVRVLRTHAVGRQPALLALAGDAVLVVDA